LDKQFKTKSVFWGKRIQNKRNPCTTHEKIISSGPKIENKKGSFVQHLNQRDLFGNQK